jgi:IS1 family transposase
MPAHVLRYSAVANNLTSKLTESDTAEIISDHYPAYVQRMILSAGGMDILLRCEFAK